MREYQSYWMQCVLSCTNNLKAPGFEVGYYSVIPQTELFDGQVAQEEEIHAATVDGWLDPAELLNCLRYQAADIRLERFDLGYLSAQVVDTVDRYHYLDQDNKLTQDLRWALTVGKEKERINPKKHESQAFKQTLSEYCDEIVYYEYTLKRGS